MSETDEERRLKILIMRAELDNKRADTEHKRGLAKYEPWKVVIGAFTAGAAVVGGMVALENYLNPRSSMFPPGTVITIPLPKP
jgi:hypothetical protein